MPVSQNGWAASPNKDAIGIIQPTFNGISFPQGIKSGDVAVVLMYVIEQFHKTVEPLKAGWCWGYYYKVIEGSDKLSNHASGTAIDLNAPRHPMGMHDTFSPTQRDAIKRILNTCEDVVRWGGNYNGRPDDMHFEINRGSAEVARVAKKLLVKDDDVATQGEFDTLLLNALRNNTAIQHEFKKLSVSYTDGDFPAGYNVRKLLLDTHDNTETISVPSGVTDEQLKRVLVDIMRNGIDNL